MYRTPFSDDRRPHADLRMTVANPGLACKAELRAVAAPRFGKPLWGRLSSPRFLRRQKVATNDYHGFLYAKLCEDNSKKRAGTRLTRTEIDWKLLNTFGFGRGLGAPCEAQHLCGGCGRQRWTRDRASAPMAESISQPASAGGARREPTTPAQDRFARIQMSSGWVCSTERALWHTQIKKVRPSTWRC